MDIQVTRLEDSQYRLEDVFHLIQDAYSERAENGIHFWLSTCSYPEYEEKVHIEGKQIFVAVDKAANVLAGTIALTVRKDSKGQKYGGLSNVAVHKDYQHHHVGSTLARVHKEHAAQQGCKYLRASTAEKAESSIKWHLKNGFCKVGYASFSASDYYSVIFRQPLNGGGYFLNGKLSYWCSYVITHLLWHEDGSWTNLGNFLYNLKHNG